MLFILIITTILYVSSFVSQKKISYLIPLEMRKVQKLKFEKYKYPKRNFTEDAITWYIAAYGKEKYLKDFKNNSI